MLLTQALATLDVGPYWCFIAGILYWRYPFRFSDVQSSKQGGTYLLLIESAPGFLVGGSTMKILRDLTELNDLVFWFSLIQKLMRIGRNSSIRYMESGCSMDP